MFHKAVKIIIITEKFLSEKVCRLIDAFGVPGYTLVPAGGKGRHHIHSTAERASVVEEFTNMKIEVIVNDRRDAESLAEALLKNYFQDFPGILYLEDVFVRRSDIFALHKDSP